MIQLAGRSVSCRFMKQTCLSNGGMVQSFINTYLYQRSLSQSEP